MRFAARILVVVLVALFGASPVAAKPKDRKAEVAQLLADYKRILAYAHWAEDATKGTKAGTKGLARLLTAVARDTSVIEDEDWLEKVTAYCDEITESSELLAKGPGFPTPAVVERTAPAWAGMVSKIGQYVVSNYLVVLHQAIDDGDTHGLDVFNKRLDQSNAFLTKANRAIDREGTRLGRLAKTLKREDIPPEYLSGAATLETD
jgi:hypothetical protein